MNKVLYNQFIVLLTSRLLQTNNMFRHRPPLWQKLLTQVYRLHQWKLNPQERGIGHLSQPMTHLGGVFLK
jgi:hypothetical protein